jgi:hypothetical protein
LGILIEMFLAKIRKYSIHANAAAGAPAHEAMTEIYTVPGTRVPLDD